MTTDVIDDLAHEIDNALICIALAIKQFNWGVSELETQHGRIKDAWGKYKQDVRKCPYAGLNGAMCKFVKKENL